MPSGRMPWPLAVVPLGACTSQPPSRPDGGVRVQLADSVRFENELIGVGYLRRVAVHSGAGTDTIEGVVT
ncbi:MAG: hypothetical protein M3125_00885, partial [Gemmatimonadota bacterium]|nr:hypothetical protein [Gemmatimonadota bacterium]